jgi:hypothetical protein
MNVLLHMAGCGLEISASTLCAFMLQFILYFCFNPCNLGHMSNKEQSIHLSSVRTSGADSYGIWHELLLLLLIMCNGSEYVGNNVWGVSM